MRASRSAGTREQPLPMRHFILPVALFALPATARAQLPPAMFTEQAGTFAIGIHGFGGLLPDCEEDCANFTYGAYIERENGQTFGIDADWFDISDVTLSFGFPTGRVTTLFTAGFGRQYVEQAGDEDGATRQGGNRIVTTALGVGVKWRNYIGRIGHDGANAYGQVGLAITPAFLR